MLAPNNLITFMMWHLVLLVVSFSTIIVANYHISLLPYTSPVSLPHHLHLCNLHQLTACMVAQTSSIICTDRIHLTGIEILPIHGTELTCILLIIPTYTCIDYQSYTCAPDILQPQDNASPWPFEHGTNNLHFIIDWIARRKS